MSFAAVQKHVTILEAAGIVTKHAHGWERRVRANPSAIRQVHHLLGQFEQLWRDRVARLDDLLSENPPWPSATAS